ncbi:hypothetical protein SORDD20_00951 [Streptococcus oralis]|nr:hypothetical protein SORDD20_00951 [Streptococcus oralis]
MVKWKEELLQGGKDEETNHRCLGSWFLGNCPFAGPKRQ